LADLNQVTESRNKELAGKNAFTGLTQQLKKQKERGWKKAKDVY
jgi:hypothetical protein